MTSPADFNSEPLRRRGDSQCKKAHEAMCNWKHCDSGFNNDYKTDTAGIVSRTG